MRIEPLLFRSALTAILAATLTAPTARAQASPGDVEALRRRVTELVTQNRQMQSALQELKAQLETLSRRQLQPDSESTSPPAAAPPDAVVWPQLVERQSRLRLYGFLRTDLLFDSQRPNNSQLPLFITAPEGEGRENGNFNLHPRLTRFGIDFQGPAVQKLGNAQLSGKLETDFHNGGSESRQIMRVRHAYLNMKWQNVALLGGQTWDTFSPLFPGVNDDTLMWDAGNLGDRRPQLRASYEPAWERTRLFVTGGIGLSGAIVPVDLDANGYRGRLVGTEGWWGRNLIDVRGGAGQGIHPLTGRPIRSRGGWTELVFKVSPFWTSTPGFTTDDPVDSDVPGGGRVRNRAFYLGNRFSPDPNFTFGFDYLRWKTEYKGPRSGIDNRINLLLMYRF